MNYFVYKGIRSCDLGLRIEKKDVFSAPEYTQNFLSIPGRDGDLIAGDGRFPNVQVTYTVFVVAKSVTELYDRIANVKNWLYADLNTYHELSDTYDTQCYRYGVFSGKLDIDEQLNRIGMFTISFSCKPFRRTLDGDTSMELYDTTVLTNPFPFTSKPLIRVIGTGGGSLILQTGDSTRIWTITELSGYLDIDCEQMNFYKGAVSMNDKVSGNGFPTLAPGSTSIAFTGDITSVIVTPRWCCL